MRKRVFKRKRKKEQYKMKTLLSKRADRTASLAAALCLAVGMAAAGTGMTVYGEESTWKDDAPARKEVVTDIFHRHVGSAGASGGCYSVVIPHVHEGDEKNGGGCYGQPGKLHDHEGSEESGGGCYGLAVPHVTHGEGCYVEETHSHEDECYGGNCIITYSNVRVRETYTDTCPSHGSTTYEHADVTGSHSACGLGTIETELKYCQKCKLMTSRSHPFISCGKQEGTTQVLVCTKTVERYETTCGFGQGQPENWLPNCGQSDSYGLGCGLTEDTPCGRLIVTGENAADGKKVTVTVRVEDFTGGKLILDDDPFTWKDQNGNVLGQGERLEVEENGNYSVTVNLKNKDVDESGLHSSILVDGIRKEEPVATPSGSPEPAGTPTASPTPVSTPSISPTPEKTPEATAKPTATPVKTPEATVKPTATPGKTPEASLKPTEAPEKTPEAPVKPTETPEKTPEASPESPAEPSKTSEPSPGIMASPDNKPEADKGSSGSAGGEDSGEEDGGQEEPDTGTDIPGADEKEPEKEKRLEDDEQKEVVPEDSGKSGDGSRRTGVKDTSLKEEETEPTPSASPDRSLKKEKKTVETQKNMATDQSRYRAGQEKKKGGFFQSAAVKVISITAGTALILVGLMFLLLLLLCSVRVYNDNGEGRMLWLGICLVRKKEEEYSIEITEAMTEKSCTNRYCIKPGLFRLGKKEDQELVVYRDGKKTTAVLSPEMIVII